MLCQATCVRSRYGPAQDTARMAAFPGTHPRRYVLASRLSSPSGPPLPRVLPGREGRQASLFRQAGRHFWIRHCHASWAGRMDLDMLCIGCASRPPLSPRLTPGGRTLPGKPWPYGGRDPLPPSLLTPAFSLDGGPPLLAVRLRPPIDASPTTRGARPRIREFGATLSPGKFSARRRLTSELLRTL